MSALPLKADICSAASRIVIRSLCRLAEAAREGPRGRSPARDGRLSCPSARKTQKLVPVRSSFGESRPCLFSLLERLSSPSQCLLRLFLVQLLYPCSQNCCVARK